MSHVVTVPSTVLRQPAKPVSHFDARVQSIIKDMINTLKAAKNPQGVGLAASQIGVPLRIFLIRPVATGPITVFINPEITRYSQRTTHPTGKKGVYEGCLSIPHYYAPLTRSSSVTVKYLDADSKSHQKSYSGFPAHIVQHEMDHLNGILFIDRVLEQNTKLYKAEGKEWQEIPL